MPTPTRVNGDLYLRIDNNVPDIVPNGRDVAQELGLETALLISIFTNKKLPTENRGGAWLDIFEPAGESMGSLLWTLDRSKVTDKTPEIVRGMVLDSVQWMKDDKIIDEIEATATRDSKNSILITVQFIKNADKFRYTFSYNFENQTAKAVQ